MPIAFITTQTFAVSLACDVKAFANAAERPRFRFRYLSEADRIEMVDVAIAAKAANSRDQVRSLLFPMHAASLQAEKGRTKKEQAAGKARVAELELLRQRGEEPASLEKFFRAAENMPAAYRGWEDCTLDEWLELADLVLGEQELAEIELKKSQSPSNSSAAMSAEAASGTGPGSPAPEIATTPAGAAGSGEAAQTAAEAAGS
jgi:hypothetical protein